MGSSLIIAAFVSLVCIYRARAIPDLEELASYCNVETYDPLSDYEAAVDVVCENLILNTARNSYKYFTRFIMNDEDCYGFAECRRSLPAQECTDCLHVADTKLIEQCPFGVGASITLKDCYIRYEDYPFLENED